MRRLLCKIKDVIIAMTIVIGFAVGMGLAITATVFFCKLVDFVCSL